MSAKGIASRITSNTSVRRLRAAIRGGARSHPLPLRDDPIPRAAAFPQANYVILVDGIPRLYAGRTASILTKTRLWKERAGVEATMVTAFSSAELGDLEQAFSAKGALAPGVRMVSLLDYYPDDSTYDGPGIVHPLEEPGLRWVKDKTQSVYRYFDSHGVYRLYRRFDYDHRLVVQDYFNENRARTRRDEFRPNGTLKRTVYYDLTHNKPRQDIYFANNGAPMFNHWTAVGADGATLETQRVTYFDSDGAPVRVGMRYEPVLHACLDNMIGDTLTFVTCEARKIDHILLGYDRPNVKRLFVLHNAHISEPFDDIDRIRDSYKALLSRTSETDAVVFLTRTQRADAEAHFGRHEQFKVIPHSAQQPPASRGVERDMKRVVMIARLDQQKQVDHAINAFQLVVEAIPDAKLHIYGRGPLMGSLNDLIGRLNLQDSVALKGYTTDVHAVYRSAGLCIMTSRYEGAPLTVVESLMHGCPVISYDLKYGPADIITNDVNGYLVPYGDVGGMARKIVDVMSHPDVHRGLIDRATLDTANFSEDAFIRRWSGLFNELTAASQPIPDVHPEHEPRAN